MRIKGGHSGYSHPKVQLFHSLIEFLFGFLFTDGHFVDLESNNAKKAYHVKLQIKIVEL